MSGLLTITVCVGSGCHVKGSYQIIEKLKDLLKESKSKIELDLEACFCQGQCTDGVVIRFADELVTNVGPENIEQLFKEKVHAHEQNHKPSSN